MKSKFKIELTTVDWLLEVAGIVGIVLSFALVAFNYNDLPAMIPKHFTAMGHSNSMGSKNIIWLSPIIGLIAYLGLTLGIRFPQLINYPFEITGDNEKRQYKNVVAMIRFIKTAVVLTLLYVTYTVIENGLGKMDGTGILFIPLTFIIFIGIFSIFLYRGYKLR